MWEGYSGYEIGERVSRWDGGVSVREEGKAVLSVTNTGPLIPPAEVDRLFQPFQRLDRHRANYSDGHGLGLSIVRAIVTAHDATVTARSMPDGGLSVSVTFPHPASPAASLENHSLSDGRARRAVGSCCVSSMTTRSNTMFSGVFPARQGQERPRLRGGHHARLDAG